MTGIYLVDAAAWVILLAVAGNFVGLLFRLLMRRKS